MQFDALVFDAYGTLYDVHSVARGCERLFPGRGMALSRLWRAKQLEYTWLRSLMGRYAPFSAVTRDALAHAGEALGLELAREGADALMAEYLSLDPYAEVPKAFSSLVGIKKAILSNGSPDLLGPLVAHSGLELDAVISVDELGVYKPAPQVYALAVRRLEVPKERIGFVSSNCWDALGAKSFGFSVFWVNRARAPLDRLGFQPDRVLAGLDEILL